jgi:hypothetical protein
MARVASLLLIAAQAAQATQEAYYAHLALSSDPTQMHVQWRTDDSASLPVVQYGTLPSSLSQSSNGTAWSFTDGGRTYYLRRATMTGLTPGALTYYTVGASAEVLNFTATRTPAQISEGKPLRIAWFGDLGWQNAQALPYLVAEAAAGAFDHFIHVGECVRPPPPPDLWENCWPGLPTPPLPVLHSQPPLFPFPHSHPPTPPLSQCQLRL